MDKRKLSELEKLRLKDRGDMVRRQKQKEQYLLKNQPDRGDVVRSKFLKLEDKFRTSQPERKKVEYKEEHKVERVSQSTDTYPELGSPKLPRRMEMPEKQPKLGCVEYRKRIRDRYTLKPKVLKDVDVKKEELIIIKEELPTTNKSSSEPKERAKSKESLETRLTKSDRTKTDKASVRKAPIKRKPIIKTITAKNDSLRVYKAVTFVDQKKSKPLEIKIPSEVKKVRSKPKLPKKDAHIQIEPSKVSVVKVAKKRKVLKKHNAKEICNFPTPAVSSAKILSPETEVAKWSSSNNHTMPYYEAWVNTTLAAISKYSKKDKLYLEKQNILQTFKRQLQQRQLSPELLYDKFEDERYTGKIKVRQGLKHVA
ncbi:uncharacterized protein [Choristoneura fumiferana]|uniref:uncharacterized protein n=1 Tax=Choristoneura fumiferana TaxID=7141 RepID=UPI003D15C92C